MKKISIYFILILFSLFIFSCKYDFILPEEVPEIPDDVEISFATQIAPIFTTNNNCTSCHNGNQLPDLTAEKAYSSLNSTRYINKTSPAESLIYLHPSPATSTHMHKKYTAAQAATLLLWIQQGAKNN